MNLATPMTVLAVVLTITSSAAAQGFRGFATGSGGNSSGSGQSGMTTSPTRSGTPGSVTITTTPRPAVTPAPGVTIQSTPQAAVPQFVPPVFHGGGVTVAPANPVRHTPTVIIESPGLPHRPPPTHRPPLAESAFSAVSAVLAVSTYRLLFLSGHRDFRHALLFAEYGDYRNGTGSGARRAPLYRRLAAR